MVTSKGRRIFIVAYAKGFTKAKKIGQRKLRHQEITHNRDRAVRDNYYHEMGKRSRNQ